MRLAPASHAALVNPVAGVSTLDEVLTHNAQRDPDGLALVDARLPFEGTWRETDRAVSALAAAFAGWRLKPDAVVGVQLGSSFESALVCLALWRAGLTAALLPLAWRRREITAALAAVGAEAVVVRTQAAGGRPAESVCEAAVDLERLRFIGVFGADEPDGATPLDEVLEQHAGRFARADRPMDAADHVAVITFDAGAVPVPRSHNELVALGLAPVLAARLTGADRLFSTLDFAGLPGLACGFTPWIVTRCAAAFHQPSSTEAFAEAARRLQATLLVAPGAALPRLVKDGALKGVTLTAAIAAWRAPDPRSSAAQPAAAAPLFVDAIAFGELGLVATERPGHGRPAPLALGAIAPEGLDALIETRVAEDGRLGVRGPACPSAAFPVETGSALAFGAEGWLDTGLVGLADHAAGRLALGGRRGVLQAGGLSVLKAEAQRALAAVGLTGALDAQSDADLGSRLRLTLHAPSERATDVAARLETEGFGPAFTPTIAAPEASRGAA
ncbi:hypothetical protein GCM10008171_10160 [Methylopila jiangsuensis]|uniref:AMP-dependent synthetase/ligase domain-containing protein n=1 Tax=Methylopila jiangsuensis TaxID=586230 RepID=A0A9W6N368_9HYPH|nr:AMP-binding protein [Methylopila jiangsuensis]MDR6286005.1 non-ribosomal peptide synthetase component E (peptide arylation enzyme) [Methylopila jiangsuensis]GLK75762.1 hypothetical protein GCM10008171_10160 [Methylopila jiangsuensis]